MEKSGKSLPNFVFSLWSKGTTYRKHLVNLVSFMKNLCSEEDLRVCNCQIMPMCPCNHQIARTRLITKSTWYLLISTHPCPLSVLYWETLAWPSVWQHHHQYFKPELLPGSLLINTGLNIFFIARSWVMPSV